MRHLSLVFAPLVLAACDRSGSTNPPEEGAREPMAGAVDNPVEPTPAETGALPAGAFDSAGLDHWPCGATIELQDGGGTHEVLFAYSRLESCVIPGELVSNGVVGCPNGKVVRRLGDTDPMYTVQYEYDPEGNLIARVEGETAPESFGYEQQLVHDRGTEVLSYSTGPDGFVVEDDQGVRMRGTVADGKLQRLHKEYPKINRDIDVVLTWDGDRLVSIDSGGDIVTFDYSCRDANRT